MLEQNIKISTLNRITVIENYLPLQCGISIFIYEGIIKMNSQREKPFNRNNQNLILCEQYWMDNILK
jgi:hypothetical protein